MKYSYDGTVDALYVTLRDVPVARTYEEIPARVMVDLAAGGHQVRGVEMLGVWDLDRTALIEALARAGLRLADAVAVLDVADCYMRGVRNSTR
jgi:uncharacterized protein YuzE